MRTIYKVSNERGRDRTFHSTREEALQRIRNNGTDDILGMEEIQIQDNNKYYAVYISDDDFLLESDAMYCEAKDVSEARKTGETYIREWSLYDQRIRKIEQVC